MASPPSNLFRPATKQAARLRLALTGTSGSGKTFTALAVAAGLGSRIAVIDTEHGSASKYADLWAFDVLELASFDPRSYIDAIQAAESEGYDVVVIDSLSHEWIGKGGALEMVDKAATASRSGNSFAAWGKVTPLHNALIEAMIRCRCHLIATMRAKTEYVLQTNANGKQEPIKIGMAPVQRDGMEFEFDVVGDLTIRHELVVTKSRCRALDGAVIDRPGLQVAQILKDWLSDGQPVTAAQGGGYVPPALLDPETTRELVELVNRSGMTGNQVRSMLARRGVVRIEDLTAADADEIARKLKGQVGLYPFQAASDAAAPDPAEGVAETMAAARVDVERRAAVEAAGADPDAAETFEVASAVRPDRNAAGDTGGNSSTLDGGGDGPAAPATQQAPADAEVAVG